MTKTSLVKAAESAAVLLMRLGDYGEESVNYLNGQSAVFPGDAWKHIQVVKRRLKAALAENGVSSRDLLVAAHRKVAP